MEHTLENCKRLTKEQVQEDKKITKEQHDALFQMSYKLLDFFNYSDDKDCNLHPDDFTYFIMDDIINNMKTLKDRFYKLYTHRKHQRC